MELTPNEIRNQRFSQAFRGYNKTEVDAFLAGVATSLEEARVQAIKLTEEKEALAQRYQELKNIEETIKMAVMEAQRGAELMLSNARKEADLLVAEARRRRDELIEERHRKAAELERRIEELDFTRRSLYTKLRADIGAHLKLLENLDPVTAKPESPVSEAKSALPQGENSLSDIDRIVEQFQMEAGIAPKPENSNNQGEQQQ